MFIDIYREKLETGTQRQVGFKRENKLGTK